MATQGPRVHSIREVERIASALRREIVSGALPVGSTLAERQIGERFDAGRSPVRRAIQRLVDEGLAEFGGARTAAHVLPFTVQDLLDLLLTCQQTSAFATYLGAQRRTSDDLERLDGLLRRIESALRRHRDAELLRLGIEFRELTLRASDNSVLQELDRLVSPRLYAFLGTLEGAGLSLAAHREVLQAFRERDGERASAILNRLYDGVIRDIRELSSKGDLAELPASTAIEFFRPVDGRAEGSPS